jgi:hypothetical protein
LIVLLIAFAPEVLLFNAAGAQKMLELHTLCAALDASPLKPIPQREHLLSLACQQVGLCLAFSGSLLRPL